MMHINEQELDVFEFLFAERFYDGRSGRYWFLGLLGRSSAVLVGRSGLDRLLYLNLSVGRFDEYLEQVQIGD